MLILTRKVDQAIIIQGNILVTVLRVERDRVKLGISAPEEITVLREELLARDAANNKQGDPANTGDKDAPPSSRFHFLNRPGSKPSESSSPDRSDGN
jgi:carbon storage regulator